MKKVNIYSDGACKGSTGKGGYAGLMECKGNKIAIFGSENKTSNNAMELKGALCCLNKLTEPCNVSLVSDSQYVVKSINSWIKTWSSNGWRKSDGRPLANVEQLKELKSCMDKHKIKAKWVKGHNGHVENELCDYLASEAAK